MFALLVLFISPLLAAEKTGLYLSGFGMVTSAKNIGYNKDAPGVEGKFTLLTNRIGFALNGYYSTARKVATHQGYGSGGTLKALYRGRKNFNDPQADRLLGMRSVSRFT